MHPVLLVGPDADLEVRDADDRLSDGLHGRDADPLTVQVRPGALLSHEVLVEERRVDDPEDRLTSGYQREGYGTERALSGEVDRAVDRIKDPSRVDEIHGSALFLAEERDVRRRIREVPFDCDFDLEIDVGREVAIARWYERPDVRPTASENVRAKFDGVLRLEE